MSGIKIGCVRKEDAPCRHCDDRYSGCHDNCAIFKAYRDKLNNLQKQVKTNMDKEKDYRDFFFNEIYRCKKLGGKL